MTPSPPSAATPLVAPAPPARKVTVPQVRSATEPLVMVTAYDCPQARTADLAGVDLVLVGDSLAMVVLGHDDTLALELDEMLHHVKAARRGVTRALLVADMPFGSFHTGAHDAVRAALRLVKEGGAQAVKIEGSRPEIVAALSRAEIPVMAHLGLTPQSLHQLGGYKVQARGEDAADALVASALELEAAGAFSLVLECVPAALGKRVTEALSIPTIGIGAGVDCGGQVLVYHDLLGLEDRAAPRFVRRYAQLGVDARDAIARYAGDVRARRFPAAEESYSASKKARKLAPPPTGPVELERIYG